MSGISLALWEGVMKRYLVSAAAAAFLLTGCTGGQETTASQETVKSNSEVAATEQQVDVHAKLNAISRSIPLYPGTTYRDDMTKRDMVMIRNQYGADAQVLTLATDDSFPQVWHYYTTYLEQFRGYTPAAPYPPEKQNWRTMQVHLNQAMVDPFIPGDSLTNSQRQVILQVSETESEPTTVVRYILTNQVPQTIAESQNGGRGAAAPPVVAAPGESAEAPDEAR
jgi:hypothetical protein